MSVLASVSILLDKLVDDEILEEGTTEGVGDEFGSRVDPEEKGGDGGVVEVDLRSFSQTLVDVGVVGREEVENEGGGEEGEPVLDSRRGDADLDSKA